MKTKYDDWIVHPDENEVVDIAVYPTAPPVETFPYRMALIETEWDVCGIGSAALLRTQSRWEFNEPKSNDGNGCSNYCRRCSEWGSVVYPQ